MISLTPITACDVFVLNLISFFLDFIIIVFSIIKQLRKQEEQEHNIGGKPGSKPLHLRGKPANILFLVGSSIDEFQDL